MPANTKRVENRPHYSDYLITFVDILGFRKIIEESTQNRKDKGRICTQIPFQRFVRQKCCDITQLQP
jgi:hypothetical protein